MESGPKQQALGWAATDSSAVFSPFPFARRANGADDVTIKIIYCGICHTDLHFARNDFGTTAYPVVPGHEIAGIVTEVGSNAKEFFKVGDRVGVGCMIDACNDKSCDACSQGLENHCPKWIMTYNGIYWDGSRTYGGYSNVIVVHYRYVLRFPEKMAMDAGAPLLCAGITVYSPMKFYGMTQQPHGKHLGVVGLGGLGHVAVKMGKAFGMKVTVISSSPHKEKEAIHVLHADNFLVSKDDQQMQVVTDPIPSFHFLFLWQCVEDQRLYFDKDGKLGQEAAKSLDYIIDTVSAVHVVDPLLNLLKLNGKLIFVGAPEKPLDLPVLPLLYGRRMIGGSLIGGIEETQEMLDFCSEHNITCEIETIRMDYVNTAMERLARGDVKYRFVIDVAASLQ